MKILELDSGKFQVYSTCRNKYNVYIQRNNGHFCCYGNITEAKVDELIIAWYNINNK